MRRTGQEDDYPAGFLEPLSGSGTAIVGQNVGAVDHVGLPFVDFGHLAIGGGEALRQPIGNGGIEDKFAVKRLGDGFAGDIVFGGSEAAGENQDGGAGQGLPHLGGHAFAIVADDALGDHFDAELVQLRGEIERVGIDALAGEHLTADGDDLGVH